MKSVLITGSAGVLGSALARAFGRSGWRLILTSRSAKKLDSLARQLEHEGMTLFHRAADVRSEKSVRDLMRAVALETPTLECLVNNAGVAWFEPVEHTSLAHWEETLAVNVTGPFLMVREALPFLKAGKGTIINISSGAGRQGFPGLGAYCASKFALMGLGQSLAEEVRGSGVRVTTLCPGSLRGGLVHRLPAAMRTDESEFLDPAAFAEEVVSLAGGAGDLWISEADYRSFPGGY
jgi:NAD(P)-dependent dehydrogenase (short-subunit alcohol dehydrogenase family)